MLGVQTCHALLRGFADDPHRCGPPELARLDPADLSVIDDGEFELAQAGFTQRRLEKVITLMGGPAPAVQQADAARRRGLARLDLH